MVLGSGIAKKILVSIEVMTDAAEQKLQNFERQTRAVTRSVEEGVTGQIGNAQQTLDQFGVSTRGLGNAQKEATNRTATLNDRIATFGKDARFASDMANQFRMDMLSVMFAGMQLMSVFGGMLTSMFKFTGAADAMGAAMKSVMLPITMALQPLLIALSEWLMQLDDGEKMVIGLSVVLLALTGLLAFMGAQIVMLSGAISGMTISLWALEIAVATIIGSLFALVGGLMVGMAVVEFFGNKIGAIVGILAAVGAAIAFVLGAPLWIIIGLIGIVIGVIIALSDEIMALLNAGGKWLGQLAKKAGKAFGKAIQYAKELWNGFKEWLGKAYNRVSKLPGQIWNVLKKLGRFITNSISWLVKAAVKVGEAIFNKIADTVGGLPQKIWNTLKSVAKKMKSALGTIGSAALDIGSKIIDSIAQGMKNAPDAIMNAIKSIAPDWVVDVLGKAGSAIKGGIQSVTDAAGNVVNVNDFVMTPNGDVLKTAPDDYIFGTKTPGALAGGGGGDQITINVDAEVSDDIDIRQLADEIEGRLDRRTGGRSNMGRGGMR